MKYKGIELKEITKPQVFDPPKEMLVWDTGSISPFKSEVCAIVKCRNTYLVITTNLVNYYHCAEIPEEAKPRRATNKELANWLITGMGEKSEDVWSFQVHPYLSEQANVEVGDKIKIRKWGDSEWHEPTVDYMGIE